jgi:type IV pilus assembly protein PilF
MNRFATPLLVALALALAACASKGGSAPQQPQAQAQTQLPQAPEPTAGKPQEASPKERAQIRTELAAGYYQRGQMDVALEELGNAKMLDPSYPKIYDIYGLVYAMLGERAKAEENFRHAIALAPDNSEYRENWGAFLCGTGRASEAMPEFEQVLKDPLYKTPEIALINAGKCSVAIGDSRKGEEYLRRALTVSPGNPIAAYNLALLAYKEKRLGEARAWMRPVMLQASPPPQALYLGACIEKNHGDREAERSYESQLRKRWPDSPEAKALASGECE